MSHVIHTEQAVARPGKHSAGRAAFMPRLPFERQRVLRVIPVGVLVAASATTSALALTARVGVDAAQDSQAGGTPTPAATITPGAPQQAVVISPAAFDASPSATTQTTTTEATPTIADTAAALTAPKHRATGQATETRTSHKAPAKHRADDVTTPSTTKPSATASGSAAATPSSSSSPTAAASQSGDLLGSVIGGLLGQ